MRVRYRAGVRDLPERGVGVSVPGVLILKVIIKIDPGPLNLTSHTPDKPLPQPRVIIHLTDCNRTVILQRRVIIT